MRVASTRSQFVRLILAGISALLVVSNANAQSVAANIRPVAQVCMAEQACVGSPSGGSSSSAQAMNSTPVVQETAEVEESLQEEAATAAATTVDTASADSGFDVAAQYQLSCFACHASGAAGAPLLGDADAWNTRMEKGMDAVMTNVISGVNAMPARGLCMDCTDDNLRAIVDYMITQ